MSNSEWHEKQLFTLQNTQQLEKLEKNLQKTIQMVAKGGTMVSFPKKQCKN